MTKTFRYDAGTETVIPAHADAGISDEMLEAYRLYVENKFQLSSNIVNSDYYAHVFDKQPSGGSLEDTVVFTDIKSIFNQASVLYMYRNGYVDPETPDTFGGKARAKLGEFVDVLYRIAGRPETDSSALPPDSESEDFDGTGSLLRRLYAGPGRNGSSGRMMCTACTDKVDYQTACVLISPLCGYGRRRYGSRPDTAPADHTE